MLVQLHLTLAPFAQFVKLFAQNKLKKSLKTPSTKLINFV